MTAGAPTIGGLKRLSNYLAGQLKSAVNITGGTIDNIAINSYNMPDGGDVLSTDQFPMVRDGVGYLVDNITSEAPLPNVSETIGNYTLSEDDRNNVLISTDSASINYFLPSGLPAGFIVRSYQGGTGQINYIPIEGATVIDGVLRSLGRYTSGYFVDIQNLGSDQWIILGDTTEGVLEWSIVGNTYLNEGDAATYIIYRPDSTYALDTVTLTVTGTGFAASGLDQTLEQALTNLTLLEPEITFDGVDTLTITPDAINPFPISLFAQPTYTAVGDRSITITIDNPSEGEVNLTQAAVTTDIINISKPTPPADLFVQSEKIMAIDALSGATILYLDDVDDLTIYSTVYHANIPALSYITAIDTVAESITISIATTGAIDEDDTLDITPPGWHFDFSTSSGMVLDGSNKVASVADKINGYPLVQGTAGNQPTYVAASLNSLGGISFNGGTRLTANDLPICRICDTARSEYTIFMVAKLSASAATGYWFDGWVGLQNNVPTGAFTQAGTSTVLHEVTNTDAIGTPYIWQLTNDGAVRSGGIKCNGQRIFMPATLTLDAASGQRVLTLDSTASLQTAMCGISPASGGIASADPNVDGMVSGNVFLITSIDSPTQVTMNQNLVETMKSGQTVYFYSNVDTNKTLSTAKTTTSVSMGSSVTNTNRINAIIYEMVVIPRILSLQESRGVNLYLSNKWSTSTTTTTTAASAAGLTTLALTSATNVRLYQTVSGTGIVTGSTVIKISTNTITLDTPIAAPGVGMGDTITFHNCSFKAPALLDVSEWTPTYRDNFVNGADLTNYGTGWRPYYGDPNSPGTFNGAYGILGHGSSNNGTAEKEWYLDVLNWSPWLKYTPFTQFSDDAVPKGGLKITASPTNPDIADLIGYAPPQPAAYTYTSGYLKAGGAYFQQYGYFEIRMKANKILGEWPAFWLTAANGRWPPEIDIFEGYGYSPSNIKQTYHRNRSFSGLFTARSTSTLGDLLVNFGDSYVLFGANLTPETVTFYVNRETVAVIDMEMSWDMHTPYFMQFNMAVEAAGNPDGITPMPMWVDYVASWRAPDQDPVITGDTQPETTALVAAMTTPPSGAREIIINTMIEKLIKYETSFGQSLWDSLDFLVVPAAATAQAGRINWKDPTQVGTVVGTPTFTANSGYAGVLNASYIDMGFVLSGVGGYQLNTALNQSSVGAYVLSVANTTSLPVGTAKFNINPRNTPSMLISLWTNTGRTAVTSAANGYLIGTRNHFGYCFYQNGEIVATGTSGKPVAADNVHTTDSENLKIANGTAKVCVAHGGTYLTPDDARYLNAIIVEYLTAVGAI